MTEHIIEVVCDDPHHDGRLKVVERFTLHQDAEGVGHPGAWRLVAGLRSRRGPAGLDSEDQIIKPSGILRRPTRPTRHTFELRCDCGAGKRLRRERLEPVLARAAESGARALPLSWFLRLD